MYEITEIDGFKIFKADEQAQARYTPVIREVKSENERFLQAAEQPRPEKFITGSFVYAHPPNYLGAPTLEWGVEQWRELLQKLRASGMDTVIFQAALWNELKECYYPSRAFGSYKMWNVIEPLLEAAAAEKIRVFLGGYGSTVGWNSHLDDQTAAREEKACIDCLTELLEYRNAFHGFYFTCETAYTGAMNPGKIARLNRIYKNFFEHIKSVDASLQIMMSPATKYFPGKEEEMREHWLATLDKVPVDILAPQDSIGTCGSKLSEADGMYRVWKAVCEHFGIRLWANIEIFERTDLSLANNSVTASPERVIAQMNLAAPYVEKLVCWEAPYYFIHSESPRAAQYAGTIFR